MVDSGKVVSSAPSPGILARWLSEYADVVEFRIPVIRVLQVEEDGFRRFDILDLGVA